MIMTQTESYRGRKLTVRKLKGRDWGYVQVRCNGAVVYRELSHDEQRSMLTAKLYVDAAIERPDAYPSFRR